MQDRPLRAIQLVVRFEVCVLNRLPSSRDGELDNAIHTSDFFARHIGLWREALYFSGDLPVIARSVKAYDPVHAAVSTDARTPHLSHSVSDSRASAQTCDDSVSCVLLLARRRWSAQETMRPRWVAFPSPRRAALGEHRRRDRGNRASPFPHPGPPPPGRPPGGQSAPHKPEPKLRAAP